jgi:hypothetical protein
MSNTTTLPYEQRRTSLKRSNQFTRNPKQELFLKNYYDPTSETFGNVFQSAVQAGYKESYAKQMAAPAVNNLWLRENDKTSLNDNHITTLVERIAIKGRREGDQLRALELLAKMHGLIVDRSQNLNVNIETALESLK